MAQTLNPTYLLPPDQAGKYAATQAEIDQQREIAKALIAQGFKDDSGTQMAGPIAIRKSPLEGLARMLQTYAGKGMNDESNSKTGQLAQLMAQNLQSQAGSSAPTPVSQDTGAVPQSLANGQGPTNSNAAALGSLLEQGTPAYQPEAAAAPAPPGGGSGGDAFALAKLIRGGSISALGGDQAGSAFWKNAESTPEMKNSQYAGQTPQQFGQIYTSGQIKGAMDNGMAFAMGPNGKPVASQVSGYVPGVAALEGAKAGATEAAKTPYSWAPQMYGSDGLPLPARTNAEALGIPTSGTWTGGAPTPANIAGLHAVAAAGGPNAAEARDALAAIGQWAGERGTLVPTPGTGAYQDANAKASADRKTGVTNAANDSRMRVNVLDNILSLSQEGVQTGPAQPWLNKVGGFITNFKAGENLFPEWKNQVTGAQELHKFIYQNAQRTWQAAGGSGTDAQLSSAQNSQPSDTMFPKSLQNTTRWAKAGELAVQAKANAQDAWFSNHPDTADSQRQFESQWRNGLHPEDYLAKVLPPKAADGWDLRQDAQHNLAYVNPKNPKQHRGVW